MSNSLAPTLHRALPLALASLVALAALKPATAAACSCVQPPGPKDAAQNSTAVFEGLVTRIDDPRRAKVHFQMVRSFKGPSQGESIEVRTANNSAACGTASKKQKAICLRERRFERLAHHQPGARGTRLISEATEDLNELGPRRDAFVRVPAAIRSSRPRPPGEGSAQKGAGPRELHDRRARARSSRLKTLTRNARAARARCSLSNHFPPKIWIALLSSATPSLRER